MGSKALIPNLPQRSQGDPTDPKKTDRAGMSPHRVLGASLEQEMDRESTQRFVVPRGFPRPDPDPAPWELLCCSFPSPEGTSRSPPVLLAVVTPRTSRDAPIPTTGTTIPPWGLHSLSGNTSGFPEEITLPSSRV